MRLLLAICFFVAFPVHADSPPLINKIQNKDLIDGCGCMLTAKDDRWQFANAYFRSEFVVDGKPETGWFNIHGKDINLPLKKRTPEHRPSQLGDHYQEIYAAQNISVTIDYVVVKKCPEWKESCESTGLNAELHAKQGSEKQTLSLKGNCGC